ncbi:hypothetical protein [Thiocapsa bogorovii]|uniref:hypothetical protein n=1 Tax=Thiocapsa bogorovii TaxID=521689 RepID=UPI001E34228C|nr:hypothetical protein [Thiocapsa bogorovii]UHD18504.1 hypothetical protein LT988_10950 [Thiocapsa bogorovii]
MDSADYTAMLHRQSRLRWFHPADAGSAAAAWIYGAREFKTPKPGSNLPRF